MALQAALNYAGRGLSVIPYLCLRREFIERGWIKNRKLWAFWTWCLLKAAYKTGEVVVGCQRVQLLPGQFIFGRRKAAQETSLTEQEIRTLIKFLKVTGHITVKATNKYSLITIMNLSSYQGSGYGDQPSNQPTINHQINQQNFCHSSVKSADSLVSDNSINRQLSHIQEYNNKPPIVPQKGDDTGDRESANRELPLPTFATKTKKKYTADFLAFWEAYPKKVGKDAAWKSWKKRNGDIPAMDNILSAIEKQKQIAQWKKENGQFIPNPSTWINQGRWADEVAEMKKPSW